MNESLSTVYLRLDSSSRSLAKTALAQLILKVAYHLGSSFARKDMAHQLKPLIRTSISDDRLTAALDLLCQEGKLKKDGKRFHIGSRFQKALDDAYTKYDERLKSVLERYFDRALSDKTNIKTWFQEVTVLFFETHASKWVDELCRGGGKNHLHRFAPSDIATKESFSRNGILSEDEDWLRSKYIDFLNSDDAIDSELKWDYGTSAFSSRLIAAATAVDKLTIDMFRDSTFVFDTNVLMYLGLEESDLAESLGTLEQVLMSLAISPGYFHITRREYERAMQNKKTAFLHVFDKYSHSILSEASDPFVRTALARGCTNAEDIERFFHPLMNVPAYLSKELPLKEFDEPELERAIADGEQHDETIKTLNNIFVRRFGKNKKESALRHDSGVLAGVMQIRKTRNCWLITKDGTIEAYASENTVRDECPVAIKIYTLINLLAINNGGTAIDPSNFAPLFASIIKLSLVPEKGAFQLEDLARMLEVESQIADLSDATVARIAQHLNHSRLAGKNDEQISLQLTREFQKEKLSLQTDLEKVKQDLHFERQDRQKAAEQAEKAWSAYRGRRVEELQQQYAKGLRRNRVAFVLLPAVVCFVILAAVLPEFFSNKAPWLIRIFTALSGGLLWFWINRWVADPRLVAKHDEQVRQIESIIDDEIRQKSESK